MSHNSLMWSALWWLSRALQLVTVTHGKYVKYINVYLKVSRCPTTGGHVDFKVDKSIKENKSERKASRCPVPGLTESVSPLYLVHPVL